MLVIIHYLKIITFLLFFQGFVFFFSDRFDHSPDDDHNDSITGLTSCSRLKLYASAGMDGTIRIWNDENQLIRLVKLKEVVLI